MLSDYKDNPGSELTTFPNLLQSSTNALVLSTNHIDGGYLVRVFFSDFVQCLQRIYAEFICATEEYAQRVMLR